MIVTMSWLKTFDESSNITVPSTRRFSLGKGSRTTPDNAQAASSAPRCGTSFLMVVMLVAIVLFSVINFEAMWLNLLVRIALMRSLRAVDEVIRYAAKKESGAIFKLFP